MKTTLKEQLLSNFIPGVERMLEKERDHLQYLLSRGKLIKDKNLVNAYIQQTRKYIAHYEKRLQEYRDFAAKM